MGNITILAILLYFFYPKYPDQYWLILVGMQLAVNLLDRGFLRRYQGIKGHTITVKVSVKYLVAAVGAPMFYPLVSHNRYLWLIVTISGVNVAFTLIADAVQRNDVRNNKM